VVLVGDEARHLSRVLRLGPGDHVELFDGRGTAFRAEIVRIGKDDVDLQVEESLPDRCLSCRITLATAVPKGERFDWLVEKATEMGVDRLVPLATKRSVVDPRPAKLDRLRRRIIEAAKQCGRNRLMELAPMCDWSTFVLDAHDPDKLLAHPGGVPPARWRHLQPAKSVTLAVGPEGGFSYDELDVARAAGWAVVGLGTTKLRVETAALVGCAIIAAWRQGEDEA
jgi:16S rRNA (uracil1498-N3)-methyltransferase